MQIADAKRSRTLFLSVIFLATTFSTLIGYRDAFAGDTKTNSIAFDTRQTSRALFVGPRTPVNPPNVGYHGEVMAAADPQSPDNLIVCGFRANQKTGTGYEGYVYQSGDGGKSWREVLVDASSQWVSEESCTYGSASQAYFVSGVSDTSRGRPLHEYGNMHLYRSVDAGNTWGPIQIGPFMDWTSMAVDTGHGPWRNTLYLFADSVASEKGGWFYEDRSAVLAVRRESPNLSFSITNGSSSVKTGDRSTARLPVGSVVLNDGSVLTVFSGYGEAKEAAPNKNKGSFSVEVEISRDGGKTLTKTSVYESSMPSALGGLAANPMTGEVYICWTPQYGEAVESRMMEHEESNLMLAMSRDGGQTWSVKTLDTPLHRALDVSPGTASLAVNKNGVLGFMWYGKDWNQVYFGVSFDSGASIAGVVSLTPPLAPTLQNESPPRQALADERRLMIYPPVWNDSSRSLEPVRVLAFGPNPRGVPFGNGLVADTAGIFHPIWAEVANGESHLWTRTVSLDAPRYKLSVPTTFADISSAVPVTITNFRYDHLENLITFDVTATNKSGYVIASPLIVRVMSSRDFPLDFIPDNSDNGESGNGALWELRIPDIGLDSEHSSYPRTLTFRMKMDVQAEGLGYYGEREIPLRIYGQFKP